MSCPICKDSEAEPRSKSLQQDVDTLECPQCGHFKIHRHALINLHTTDASVRWKISSWMVQNNPDVFTARHLEDATSAKVPSIHQRTQRMLRWLAKKFPAGAEFRLNELGKRKSHGASARHGGITLAGGYVVNSPLMPVGWCASIEEMNFMVTEVLCNEMGLVQSQNNHDYQISPKGWLAMEGIPNASSQVGFCAMWFSEEVKPLWTDVIEPAIRESGYEPLRIDGKQHNGKIDDEIMASIRASRFVVSDFTGNRGGVYYEAGFAHGLGLPVVFMCREGDALHFDVRQYNTIFWKPDQLPEARHNLKNRILATLGQGPLRVS